MADLQKYFSQFHDAIALKRDAEIAILADKRRKVLDKLGTGIERQRKAGAIIPTYRPLNQGSYPMGTGIKPVKGDYDLDVGLLFNLDKLDYPDPLTVKMWVHDALDGHTKEVRVREPVVTVFYAEGEEHCYHLDLAVYADACGDGSSYLGRGKEHSLPENKRWEESDPEALLKAMRTTFPDREDRAQARRVVRYAKRWKDENFSAGSGAPTGIALTACVLRWFVVSKVKDPIAQTTSWDDAQAMLDLVRTMLRNFSGVWDADKNTVVQRLSVTLPVPPGNDLFVRMTNTQMATFEQRLEKLRDALIDAQSDVDPHTAAKTLRKVFGDGFPVPEKEETAKSVGPAIVSSGNSA